MSVKHSVLDPTNIQPVKVKAFRKGHKIWKESSTCFDKTLFLLRSVKTSGRFLQIFVAFSKKLDFKYLLEIIMVELIVRSQCW